jgi:hypothetical protein
LHFSHTKEISFWEASTFLFSKCEIILAHPVGKTANFDFTAIPLLISFLAFIIDSDFFKRGDGFCWIDPDAILFSIILPFSILILNGFFCLLLITGRLFSHLPLFKPIRRLIQNSTMVLSHGRRVKSRDKLLAILNIQFLIGFPWCLQYPIINADHVTFWHYLFAIFNGSQGIIIFSLMVYRNYRAVQVRAELSQNAENQDLNEVDAYFIAVQDPRPLETLSENVGPPILYKDGLLNFQRKNTRI